MKKTLALSLIVILLAACKKDKEETVSLLKKWTVESVVEKEYLDGTLTDTYTEPGNGATMDFQENGHLIITRPGNTNESLSYSMLPDSKVNIDGDIFEIKNLAKSGVILFAKEDIATWRYETFINLKR
jgi:hypothetical protein